jgi:hypothetical protein
MIHSVHDPLARTISLKFRGVPPQKHPAKLEWEGKMCVFNGRAMSFASFVEDLFMQMVHGDQARNSIKYRQVGTHPAGCTERYGFAVGEFIFDGSDVEQIEIAGQYFVTVTRETLTSRFQLEGQGQVFSFESVEDVIPGAKLQVNVVQRL